MLKPPIKNIENESIESVKVQITRAVMLSLIFASAPALLLMVARNSALALEQSLFLFILALSACLCFLASFRYISYGKAVWLPFIALTVIVSFGLFTLGITSAGINLLVLSAILAPLLLRRPHAIFLLSGSAFVYLMFGWLYVSGYLTRDFPDLSRSPNHWGLQRYCNILRNCVSNIQHKSFHKIQFKNDSFIRTKDRGTLRKPA